MATTATEKKPLIEGWTEAPINLEWPERYVSIAAGLKFSLSGLANIFNSPFTSILKIGAGGYLINRGITGHCEVYSRVGKNSTEPVNVNIRTSFTVNKPRQEVYEFWRQLDNLPKFMKHLESVEVLDSKRSHWVLKLPANVATVSWDAEIVNDEPGYAIGWSSLPGSTIDNAGKVRFRDAEDGKGTLIDVVISYLPPAGGVGTALGHVLNPLFKKMVDDDVRNFKQYIDIDENPSAITSQLHSAVV
ncbi:SRPBCC family protein [uncultured Mucilaginibacter sp.]|uniref:SRPBCC family protein n=1 Tax=uncultured Mucilaginibacter sp. TaxID=797541 RepID=UPI0025F5C055|nr:SRPBCC family protein [uncultured Mucilaginibacter sp.]